MEFGDEIDCCSLFVHGCTYVKGKVCVALFLPFILMYHQI